jgi:hypothetical protein
MNVNLSCTCVLHVSLLYICVFIVYSFPLFDYLMFIFFFVICIQYLFISFFYSFIFLFVYSSTVIFLNLYFTGNVSKSLLDAQTQSKKSVESLLHFFGTEYFLFRRDNSRACLVEELFASPTSSKRQQI